MTYFPTVGIVKAEFADVASKVLDAVTTWRANQQGDVFTAR